VSHWRVPTNPLRAPPLTDARQAPGAKGRMASPEQGGKPAWFKSGQHLKRETPLPSNSIDYRCYLEVARFEPRPLPRRSRGTDGSPLRGADLDPQQGDAT
jgi:hypothetical protein